MRYYELITITKNFSEVEKIISSLKIKIEKQQRGPNFLAFEFYSEPEKIPELEKKLKAEPQIQKLMVLTKKVPPARPRLAPRVEGAAPEGRASLGKAERVPKKVELKEIEKKLEEILGQ